MLFGISAFGLLAGTAMAQDAKPMPAAPPAPAATTSPVIIGCCDSGSCTSGPTTGSFNTACDESCEKGSGIIASFGFWILTPRWSNNPAGYVDVSDFDSPSREVDFGYNAHFVPRIDLGYNFSGGLGARVGWWGFADSNTKTISPNANQIYVTPADPMGIIPAMYAGGFENPVYFNTGTLIAQSELEMDVWDFEVTDQIRAGKWDILLSGGLRYAHVAQHYDALVGEPDGEPGFGAIISSHNFNGAGPTFGIEGRRSIANTGLYFYGTGRLSVLFGETQDQAFGGIGATPGTIALTGDSATTQERTILPVGELELGIGYQRAMSRATLFAELGFVGQVWWGAGNSSNSSYDATLTAGGYGSSSIKNDNLGLIGFSCKAGFGW